MAVAVKSSGFLIAICIALKTVNQMSRLAANNWRPISCPRNAGQTRQA
jgi:hypothetical protein